MGWGREADGPTPPGAGPTANFTSAVPGNYNHTPLFCNPCGLAGRGPPRAAAVGPGGRQFRLEGGAWFAV